jgi:copper(I)-binding protein
MKSLIIVAALALGLVSTAQAQTTGTPSVEIMVPWARATPGAARNGAAYFTIVNKGKASDRLVAVSTPVAAMAELHRTEDDKGVMKMLPVTSVEVKAGGRAVFKPGGYHVMLMGLKAPLKEGQSFPLTLTFEKAGKLDVTVKVRKVGAMGDGHGGMKM